MTEVHSPSSLASMVDLKNFLECSICCGPFEDPRALPCMHPFCCGCLQNWAKACSEDNTIVSCPLCKQVYQIPEKEGIKGFPPHFLVANLQSTVDEAKQKKKSRSDDCENHGEKKIYYCTNCDCAACPDCCALDPAHQGHKFIRLKEAVLQHTRSLKDLTTKVKDVELNYISAVQQAQQVEHDLDQAADAMIKTIQEAKNEHMKQVDKLVTAYEQEVYSKREENRKAVHQQIETLQSNLATITTSYELATNVVESNSHSEIISLYPSLSSSLQQLIQSQPSTVDNTLNLIQLEPPHQQTMVDVSSLEQLLSSKLCITPATERHNQQRIQFSHQSATPAEHNQQRIPSCHQSATPAVHNQERVQSCHQSATPAVHYQQRIPSSHQSATPAVHYQQRIPSSHQSGTPAVLYQQRIPSSHQSATPAVHYQQRIPSSHQSGTPAVLYQQRIPSSHQSATPAVHYQESIQFCHQSATSAVTANLSASAARNPLLSSLPASAKPFPGSATGRSQPASGCNKALGASQSEATPAILFSNFKSWKEIGSTKTAPKVKWPTGITTHPINGDIAVTSDYCPVTIMSKNGDFKQVIHRSPSCVKDIAISPGNKYIIPGKLGSAEFYIYNDQGAPLRRIPTLDINDQPSTPNSVTVDSTGILIVGFGYGGGKTVSIHQPDGTLISKFETRSSPRKLACTPDDRLIISFDDNTLQILDQIGHNASIIQPPPEIKSWQPEYVCCGKQRELFVTNIRDKAVHRYVSTGGEYKYVDCIARMGCPCGIAMSANKEKLFVVDCWNSVVKILQ